MTQVVANVVVFLLRARLPYRNNRWLNSLLLNERGYCGGSPTAVQTWRPCPMWQPFTSHAILV